MPSDVAAQAAWRCRSSRVASAVRRVDSPSCTAPRALTRRPYSADAARVDMLAACTMCVGWKNRVMTGQAPARVADAVDPNFVRAVVLIAEHTDEGAMGLVLNRPAASSVSRRCRTSPGWRRGGAGLCRRAGRRDRGDRAGRVRPSEVAGALVEDDLGFVGTNADNPDALDGAIRRARVFAGHAGWGPGQLESELRRRPGSSSRRAVRRSSPRTRRACGRRCCGARDAATRCCRRCRSIRR